MWYIIDNRGSDDPAVNLAIEQYVLRCKRLDDHYILVCRNRPAVVIGKHQNVAEEVNLKYCAEKKIPLFRRLSGGGAVYHDPGNINFSFITRRSLKKVNNFSYFIEPLLRLIRRLGAEARLDARGNIIVNGLKISGNAQFTSRTHMISHGTLLYETNLHRLRRSLQVNTHSKIVSKSRKSVPDRVGNLIEILQGNLHITSFIQKAIEVYQAVPFSLSDTDWRDIEQLAEDKYRSKQWNFDRSPGSKIYCPLKKVSGKAEIILTLEQGHIVSVDYSQILEKSREAVEARKTLLGIRFDYPVLKHNRTSWLSEQGWPDILFE